MNKITIQEKIITHNDSFNFKGIAKLTVKNLISETVKIGLRELAGGKEYVFESCNNGVFSDREVQISSLSGEVKLYMEIQRVKKCPCNCNSKK